MLVQAFRDAGALLEQAGRFLLAREVQHSHLLSVLSRLEREPASAPPYLALVRAPLYPDGRAKAGPDLVAATYNVHRWTARGARGEPDPERAAFVSSPKGIGRTLACIP